MEPGTDIGEVATAASKRRQPSACGWSSPRRRPCGFGSPRPRPHGWPQPFGRRAFVRVAVAGFVSSAASTDPALHRCRLLLPHSRPWSGLANALRDSHKADLCIALAHHPLDWLAPHDRRDILPMLQSEVDILLRGHLHTADWRFGAAVGGSLVELPAGATYASTKWRNAFQLISLWPDPRKGKVASWMWYPDRFTWGRDRNAGDLNDPNGAWSFTWSRR
jgi:hypothetical protein